MSGKDITLKEISKGETFSLCNVLNYKWNQINHTLLGALTKNHFYLSR